MPSVVAALWLLVALFGGLLDGLFSESGSDCRGAKQQAERTMRRIGEEWPLRPIEDPVSKYVQRIGMRLARVVDPGSQAPWDFYVLRNAEPSAIAVGDGHFVISDGLIAVVRSESELAAVLAHEISHQTLGHFCRGPAHAVERIDRGTVVQHYELKTEMEADREAVDLLFAAGFHPGAMKSVLGCLARSQSTTGTHLNKRVRRLTERTTPGNAYGNAGSGAFVDIQRSVSEDLGDAKPRGCR